MLTSLRQIIKRLDFLLLIAVLILLFAKNYTPGTFLIGWDNLMPELNPWLNIKRSLLAVWQQHQGLGLVSGMAHSADLVHQLIILPLTLFLPTNNIRYLWHFAMMGAGTLGLLFVLKKHFRFSTLINLSASLFYLLNFGSVQNFYTPFEPFSVFWGFFPWLIASFWSCLKQSNKKNITRLAILNFLATPSFYVQTNFIVYLLCLGLISLSFFITSRPRPKSQKYFKSFATILLVNLFWLLPFFYFLKNDIGNNRQYFGNLIGSQEVFERNQRRGNLSDFLLLRGFYYDYQAGSTSIMAPWVQHFENHYTLTIGYFLSSFALIGLISLLFKYKKFNTASLSVVLMFFLSCLALLSNQAPFSYLNAFVRQISILNQVFRSPFTKFITPAVFSFSILIAYGLNFTLKLLASLKYSTKLIKKILLITFISALFIFSHPSFTGNYLSPKMRQSIKSEYFDLFNYLKNQPKTARIAHLPSGNFWGWTDYNFGITGSGFIWYAIDQPILDRTFDVWSQKNEQYYWQLDNALQKQSPESLNDIFEKYSIQYVIFDNNIFYPYDHIYAKNSLLTKSLLRNIGQLKLEKQFGQISLYRYLSVNTNLYTTDQMISVSPFKAVNQDYAFHNFGDYLSTPVSQITFPFIDIFSKRLPSEFSLIPQINSNTITVGQYQFPYDSQNPLYNQNLILFNHPKPELPFQQFIISQSAAFFRFTDESSIHSFFWNFPEIGLNQSYLIKIEYRHLTGRPLRLSILGKNNRFKLLETQLEPSQNWTESWFVIPQQEDNNYTPGLQILIYNSSFNLLSSINDIKSIKIYPFPYQQLTSAFYQNDSVNLTKSTRNYLDSISNIFYYQTKITPESQLFLVLPQSFSQGWLAFYLSGPRPIFLKNHTPANNWANAWTLPVTSYQLPVTIYIIFWPQLLEFLGFALLIPVLVYILKKPKPF